MDAGDHRRLWAWKSSSRVVLCKWGSRSLRVVLTRRTVWRVPFVGQTVSTLEMFRWYRRIYRDLVWMVSLRYAEVHFVEIVT